MATVTDDLHTYLSAQFPAETIRTGFLPTDPDQVIGIIERPGGEPPAETFVGRGRGPTLHMELPNIQIIVRTPKDQYKASRDLADLVFHAVHNLVGITISGTRYAVIEATQSPYNIGIDEQGRWLIGFGLRCWKRPN